MRISSSSATDSAAALEAAFRDVCPLVREMARKAGLSDVDEAEIVQKVGLVLVEKFEQHRRARGSWRRWAAGIARLFLLDARRVARTERARREPSIPVNRLPAASLSPEQALRAREALAIVGTAIREEHRPAFVLHALGCSDVEIGDLLDLPRTTVEWRLKEGRKDLDRALARMRETREEATRVRGVLWPFAFACEAVRGRGRDGLVRGLLGALVPALLSVHLISLPPEGRDGSGEPVAALVTARSDPAAAVEVPAEPPAVADEPSPNERDRGEGRFAPDAPPGQLPATTPGTQPKAIAPGVRPARTGGGREWMRYREIVRDTIRRGRPQRGEGVRE